MADISQITLPSGTTYDLKDSWARTQIQAITGGSAIVFKGVSSTALTDGGNENPTVGGETVTSKSTGDLYFYNQEEFIYGDDSKWHSLGEPLNSLGALAKKDIVTYDKINSVTTTVSTSNVSSGGNYTPSGTISGGVFSSSAMNSTGSYTPGGTVTKPTFSGTPATITTKGTPSGTVSQPTFNGAALNSTASYTPAGTVSVTTAGSTTTIKNPTSKTVTTAVEASTPSSTVNNEVTYYNVQNENLTLYKIGYTTGNSISTANTTVKTGDAVFGFSGTPATITAAGTPAGTVTQPTFSGAELSSTMSYTPAGTVSQPSFNGTPATITVSGTPSGTVSELSWSGQPVNITATSSFTTTAATATSATTAS